MKQLSNIEKKLVKDIVNNLHGYNFNYIIKDLKNRANDDDIKLDIIFESSFIAFSYYKPNENLPQIKGQIKAIQELIEIEYFLKYLIDNYYIYLLHSTYEYDRETAINLDDIISKNETNKLYCKDKPGLDNYRIEDEKLIELKNILIRSYIFPSQTLINYYKKGYRTEEDIKHGQLLCISFVSLSVAILIGLMGIIINILGIFGNYYKFIINWFLN